jgi:hypothetical protein
MTSLKTNVPPGSPNPMGDCEWIGKPKDGNEQGKELSKGDNCKGKKEGNMPMIKMGFKGHWTYPM